MSKFFKALEQARRDRGLGTLPPAEAAPRVEAAGEPENRVAAPTVEPRRPDAPVTRRVVEPPVVEAADGVDEHLVSLLTPAAFEAEQYRSLRHTVEQLRQTVGMKVIAVSSPTVGDGKTTTAINLAGALAQAQDARVLLVDADLRHAALSSLLGVDAVEGPSLVDGVLDARLTLGRIARPRPPFNLSVVRAGAVPPNPYEVLRSPRLGELVDEARRLYDYVVLDTPPLVGVQDCRVIGHCVDGFLLVVAAHHTPRKLVAEALTVLDQTKVIGIVFNCDDQAIVHHYSGSYRYGSPDGSDGALRRATRRVGDSIESLRRSSRTSR